MRRARSTGRSSRAAETNPLGTSNVPVLIAKAAAAVLVAYLLARELVPRDVLSATFVSMFCVSPTVYTGIRRGIAQLGASVLGGLATLAVTIPLGPGPAALSLSMVLGLGAAYWLGFGATFAVAGFTVLYVSLLGRGEVDAYFVRLASVLLGIGVSTVVNLVVSASFYRQIFGRRARIAAQAALRPFTELALAVRAADPVRLRRADESLGPVFRLLADLRDEFGDLRRELRLRRGWRGARLRALLTQERIVERLELLCHHGRDVALILRELYLEPGGAEDARAIGIERALDAIRDALAACVARLQGRDASIPPELRARYDPVLRHVAARLADGEPDSLRLELVLALITDIENLRGAAERLVDLASDLD